MSREFCVAGLEGYESEPVFAIREFIDSQPQFD